jgi:hypothetical protein
VNWTETATVTDRKESVMSRHRIARQAVKTALIVKVAQRLARRAEKLRGKH